MKKIGLFITILILVFMTLGCTTNKSDYQQGNVNNAAQPTPQATVQPTPQPTTQSTPQLTPPNQANLVILDHKLGKEEYGGYIVTGTAIAQNDLNYAEIDVKFYDQTGAVLQSSLTNVLDLKYGERWNFKVYGPMEGRVTNYTIATSSN